MKASHHATRTIGLLAIAVLIAAGADARNVALVVMGDPGTEAGSAARFYDWTTRWQALLKDTYGFKPADVRVLLSPAKPPVPQLPGEDFKAPPKLPPELNAIPAAQVANLTNLAVALANLATEAGETDQVVVVLIGHGYQQQGVGKMCLPGPDIADVEFARALAPLKAGQLVVVSFLPAGPSWAKAIAGSHLQTRSRAVVVEMLGGQTYFCEFLLWGLQHNGKTNLLDAFNNGCRRMFLWYQNQFADKETITVHGREFQELFARLYPEMTMAAGEAEPRSPDNEAGSLDKWMGRRLIADIPGLDDNGDGTPSTLVSGPAEGVDTRVEGTRKIAALPNGPGSDGTVSARLVLGEFK